MVKGTKWTPFGVGSYSHKLSCDIHITVLTEVRTLGINFVYSIVTTACMLYYIERLFFISLRSYIFDGCCIGFIKGYRSLLSQLSLSNDAKSPLA